MIARKCPVCKKKWYSANTADWVCSCCSAVLDERHDIDLEEGSDERGELDRNDNSR